MNIALLGYGRMGHEIQSVALARGHSVKLIIDVSNKEDLTRENLRGIDVVIEFSSPESAFSNVTRCLGFGVPVVSGTTGWLDKYTEAAKVCIENNTAFIHSSNFSIGMNLLFRLNEELARHMKRYPEYTVAIEEIHHTKKLDAPSGTAISLANGITANHQGYEGWVLTPLHED
ncbi:MAG TPA: dihydrodipicolinate reductase C-terminal domain-containing protein, partial [Bacteroidales bacterium]|nr:dihydrodipicolinate reductase C-terminal domain-containing protein [Bacteroidales bacterium]